VGCTRRSCDSIRAPSSDIECAVIERAIIEYAALERTVIERAIIEYAAIERAIVERAVVERAAVGTVELRRHLGSRDRSSCTRMAGRDRCCRDA
jgi:hypothetical protein